MILPILLSSAFVAACQGDDGSALPSVRESAVPNEDATAGAAAPVTLTDDYCLHAGDFTLVFVDGQAKLNHVGGERRLEVRSTTNDGGAGLASIPLNSPTGLPLLGYEIRPVDWVQEPPEGCEGPYFLVTGLATDFDTRSG